MNTINARAMQHILECLLQAESMIDGLGLDTTNLHTKLGTASGKICFVRRTLMEAAVSDVSVEPQPALAESAT